jgi:hypothetical protein
MRPPLIAILVLVGLSPPGTAGEPAPTTLEATPRYYFTLFAGESVQFRPRTAHTWGTYAKVTPQPGGTQLVEAVTISWLPADAHVKPYRLRPETGEELVAGGNARHHGGQQLPNLALGAL